VARGAVSTDAQTRSCSSRKIAFEQCRQRRRPRSLRCNDRIPSRAPLSSASGFEAHQLNDALTRVLDDWRTKTAFWTIALVIYYNLN
jgi:hypothetical protein